MILKNIDFEKEFSKDPHRFGMPTFEEFSRAPDFWRKQWRGNDDWILEMVDKGSTNLNKYIAKHEYFIDGYKCNSAEEVEKVAKDQGYKLSDLKPKIELVPMEGNSGRLKAVVEFYCKTQAPSEQKLIYPR